VSELVEFARHEFRLNKRGKDGQSLRDTLTVVERMKGFMPPEGVNPQEFPDTLYELWNWFLALHCARPTGIGISPILESEIRAFCLNRSIRMTCMEIDAIRSLDRAAMNSFSEVASRKGPTHD
jgi:hypothetical protein